MIRAKQTFDPKECERCESEFMPTGGGSKYCGKDCADDAKRENNRRWDEENPEKARERVRRWNRKNPEVLRACTRRWRRNNPDKAREKDHRRGVERGRGIRKHWRQLLDDQGPICGICGLGLDMTEDHISGYEFEVDHIIPRSRGGSNEYSNAQLSHSECNKSKGDMT